MTPPATGDGRRLPASARQTANSCLVVSPTHAEAAGHHGGDPRPAAAGRASWATEEREFTRLVAVNASEAERGLATTYRPGDVIQFHQNAKGGFNKGDAADRHRSGGGAAGGGGEIHALPPGSDRAGGGRPIRFTGNVKASRATITPQERRYAHRRRVHARRQYPAR